MRLRAPNSRDDQRLQLWVLLVAEVAELRIALEVHDVHGELEAHAAVTFNARREGITGQRYDVVRGGVAAGVGSFVNTGARRLFAGLEGFSHCVRLFR
jgi:hypothetical protein